MFRSYSFPELPRFAVALAAFAAIRCLGHAEADPVGSAESAFLALLVGGVLAAIAVVARRGTSELFWTALLATAAVWVVGYGPHRGAVVTLVLLAGLALAAGRAGEELVLAPGGSAALALGLQLLLRPDLLLPPLHDLRTVVSIAALPVAAGWSLLLLGRRFGARRAWIAGAAAVVLSPGWNVTVTLALASLAAGAELADAGRPRTLRAAAAVALAVPPLWDPQLGTLFTLGALTFVLKRGYAAWLIPVVAAMVALREGLVRAATELALFWAQVLVLLPALVLPRKAAGASSARGEEWKGDLQLVLRGLFLSLLAAIIGEGPEALAGGLALAALGLGPSLGIQRAWSGALVLGTAVYATYPWIREEPLHDLLELAGLATTPRALVAALALVGLGWILEQAERRGLRRPRPALVVGLVAAFALVRAVPATAIVPVTYKPVALDAERRPLHFRFPSQEVSGGVVDAHLIHGAGLELGTPVATVKLRDEDRKVLASWEILAGLHTAEWAAGRRDIADRPGFMAPSPYLSQIAPDGTFFAQRFRARFACARAVRASSIAVRRHDDLPPEVELVIYRLELRR